MSKPAIIRRASLALLFLMSALTLHAEPMTYSGRFDIGQWKAEAQKQFDFSKEDAVLLLEGQRTTLLPDGRTRTLVHRVVWIATDHAIETYADLRIPWDSARQSFTVKALRVWRDGRWIEHRPTAVVPTTPYEVQNAPDYTWLRETMLLHDGIELPCILEACYVIEDKEPRLDGTEGVYIFQRANPVLHSMLILEMPHRRPLNLAISDTALAADTTVTDSVDSYSMDFGPYPAAPEPVGSDPAAYLPHAAWSSWRGWSPFGKHLTKEFEQAETLSKVLVDSLDTLLRDAPSSSEKADRIAAFVKRNTRYIAYPGDWFWASPRPASRTFDTGYASALDRAILFAALAKQAGLDVWPYYHGRGYGPIDEHVATDDRLTEIGVWTNDNEVNAGYDPVTSTVFNGFRPIFGRVMWLPGSGDAPKVTWTGSSSADVRLKLVYDKETNRWSGTGYYSADGGICPYDQMEGLGDQARTLLGEVASGLLPKAEVSSYNPVSFDRFTVATGFKVEAEGGERDALGRLPLHLGEPGHALFNRLPDDVHLYDDVRGTPVILPGVLQQTVAVELDPAGMEVVRAPEEQSLENSVGSFKLTAEQKDGWVWITRTLSLNLAVCPPEKWPELRALLLAETGARAGTLLLK